MTGIYERDNMKIYMNGKLVDKADAKVSVFDHGFLYGDGAFEGIRSYNCRVFRLKEHIDRLYETMHTLMIDPRMTKKEMSDAVIVYIAGQQDQRRLYPHDRQPRRRRFRVRSP